MQATRSIPIALSIAIAAMALLPAQASATFFKRVVTVDSTPLTLNGRGVHHKAVQPLYVMALYTPQPAKSPASLMGMRGPMSLSFEMMREIDTTNIGLGLLRGMQRNNPQHKVQRHLPTLQQMADILSSRHKLRPGERMRMEYVPGLGLQFFLRGAPKGDPIGDEEFFRMVLSTWFGESATDFMLRDMLLGIQPPFFKPE